MYCVIFRERRGLLGGRNTLTEKLRDLGVVSLVRFLYSRGSTTTLREKGLLSKTYAEMAKLRPNRKDDSLWLELGERKLLEMKDQLDRCLLKGRGKEYLRRMFCILQNGIQMWGVFDKALPLRRLGKGGGSSSSHVESGSVENDDIFLKPLGGCNGGLDRGREVKARLGSMKTQSIFGSEPWQENGEKAIESSSSEVARTEFINEVLMEEASKYNTLSRDSTKTHFLSFTPSFVFGRALVVRGSFVQNGLVVVEDESFVDPLFIVLADEREWEKAEEGEKVLNEGRGREAIVITMNIRLTQEAGDFEDQWNESSLELGAIRGLWDDSWCIGGDFNVSRFPSERNKGGRLAVAMKGFSEMIDDLILRDFPLQLGVEQSTLSRPVSDHYPILLDMGEVRSGHLPFHFENMWGSSNFFLVAKLKALKGILKTWNNEVFGKVEVNKRLALQQVVFSVEEEKARKEVRGEFKKWVLMEEIS
ncbi:hypothetical protein AAG906_001909 [Vitis piasezkii]